MRLKVIRRNSLSDPGVEPTGTSESHEEFAGQDIDIGEEDRSAAISREKNAAHELVVRLTSLGEFGPS